MVVVVVGEGFASLKKQQLVFRGTTGTGGKVWRGVFVISGG